ncbi:MAG: sodium:proton antiporter [Candidatus Sumerlaeaceae bacterium]|nr:sodium:proton antiporter [Candidatus Sumerlaeaceae bacterium]
MDPLTTTTDLIGSGGRSIEAAVDHTVSSFQLFAGLLTLSAVFSYINYRFLRLPGSIGVMLQALVFVTILLVASLFEPNLRPAAQHLLSRIDFDATLLHGMLGLLLFAGAIHVDLGELRRHGLLVIALSTIGVVVSTAIIGLVAWKLLPWFGFNLTLPECLVFGALISPTDPIAVLAIMRSVGVPKDLRIPITGESLFNDGVGVVVFLALLAYVSPGHGGVQANASGVAMLFLTEAVGGAIFGLAIGYLTYHLLASVDDYQVEIILSLALAVGGYSLAEAIHVSAPIAIVVAGLLIGNHGRSFAMSKLTCERLDEFWELMDEILNSLLFVLIGLEALVLVPRVGFTPAAFAMVPLALLARACSVGLPLLLVRPLTRRIPHGFALLTWGGLRGGISVALALSLHDTLARSHAEAADAILVFTYVVVLASIIGQGLTIKPLLKWILVKPPTPPVGTKID